MKRLSGFAILALLVASVSAADLKIGVVDTAKTFTEFYKTKEAEAGIQNSANKLKNELEERTANYKKLLEQRMKLLERRDAPSPEMRRKMAQEGQRLGRELHTMEAQIREYQQLTKAQLDQLITDHRRAIYSAIYKAVEVKAKAASFDLVLDRANISMSSARLFLYLREGSLIDLTADVIAELNKNAPASTFAATGSAHLLSPIPAPPAQETARQWFDDFKALPRRWSGNEPLTR